MKKETFEDFRKILDSIEFEDINIAIMGYKIEKQPEKGEITINIGKSISDLNINQNIMAVNASFRIAIEQNNEKIMSFRVEYKLLFDIQILEQLEKSLKNNEAKKMFIENQIPKFAWSFLREDFRTACTKLGLRPITLKMMK
ncbi:hypothetical protein [Atribacter laminatus]|uniref:Preprotein translocase subunit SecB n=1 Tax=Atribacter laminatus TaxID=2847778 RepID=A0A7T1ANA8_ATRLM|nr:hypothetical protein [Atribacter laminatus]QPM69065.1 hypothetical protein RT761_02293 [Atribacter laminatus]